MDTENNETQPEQAAEADAPYQPVEYDELMNAIVQDCLERYTDPEWAWLRAEAVRSIGVTPESLAEYVLDDPQRMTRMHSLHGYAAQYAEYLRNWVGLLETMQQKLDGMDEQVKQVHPNIGYGPDNSPRLTEPGAGMA